MRDKDRPTETRLNIEQTGENGHNPDSVPPIFILKTANGGFAVLFHCKIRRTKLNSPINDGGRNMITSLKKRSKSKIGVIIRFLRSKGNLSTEIL